MSWREIASSLAIALHHEQPDEDERHPGSHQALRAFEAAIRADPGTRRSSLRQERRLAGVTGGRTTPASGATPFRKGDVRTSSLLLEAKRTDARTITLKGLDLRKISDEASAEGRVPVLAFEVCGQRWMALPEADFLEHCAELLAKERAVD